jgi:hypothetical protein
MKGKRACEAEEAPQSSVKGAVVKLKLDFARLSGGCGSWFLPMFLVVSLWSLARLQKVEA